MHVIGVSADTSSSAAFADIGALWERAGSAGVIGADTFAVYHRYELEPGGYRVTVVVGRRATADEVVPSGLARVEVPAQSCMRLDTDGSIPALQRAWEDVWKRWPDGGPRAFVADVEHWTMGPSGAPSRCDIYVGVR
jgi:predicted transcriptional regulator YdeE